MGLFNKLKQLFKRETDLKKANLLLKKNYLAEKEFFKKPQTLILLALTALLFLNNWRKKNKKSKQEIKNFLRTDSAARSILKFTLNDVHNDEILSLILLGCYDQNNPNNIPDIPDDADGDTILKIVDKINDIDNEIKHKKNIIKFQNWLAENKNIIITYGFLLYYIVDMMIDLISNYEHPSRHRTKYIQKLLRNVYALMKIEYEKGSNELRSQYKPILNTLKQLDNILIALAIATSIYIINRRKLQKRSRETLLEISKFSLCDDSLNYDPSTAIVTRSTIPFQERMLCPVVCAPDIDDTLVLHIPIEDKLCNIVCVPPVDEQEFIDATDKPDLATIAIVRNISSVIMDVSVNIGSFVDSKSLLATIGSTPVNSPMEGYIDKLTTNEIVIRDISDTDNDSLESQVTLLGEKYTKLNQIQMFLKDYYVPSLFPGMLTASKVDKGLSVLLTAGLEKQFKKVVDDYKALVKDYDKNIKNITGGSNAEKHSKNETLDKLKKEMDDLNKLFFKNINLLGGKSKILAKEHDSEDKEFKLLEYYLFDLGVALNTIENPNTIEIQYRDKITEYAQRRYVIDGYDIKDIEKKVNDFIKNIKKGINLLNQFDDILRIYNFKKKISDVEKWLKGMANNNNKLDESEKISLVKKAFYLFNFYLQIKKIKETYKDVKKDYKAETAKETKWITVFFANLWKQYAALPGEITDIEKSFDTLAMFSTYTTIDYEGEEARLYLIADDDGCDPEDDDYYNKSKYGYGSLKYWLKYCSFATLASVINPATGWSTGWIFPLPLPFPVIYIPIKPIMTKYGVAVIGISICGVYVFPWILFINMGSEYAIPVPNPAISLKNEIEALKKGLSEQLANFKKVMIKNKMDSIKQEIINIEAELILIKKQLEQHKLNRPKVITTFKSSLSDIQEYVIWKESKTNLKETIRQLKTRKWSLTQTWSILNTAYKLGTPLKNFSIKQLEKMQETVDKQLDKLLELLSTLNQLLAALPISMVPNSANFGFTLKNPKPIINIADELDDNINESLLNKTTDKFNLKNKDLMSSNYDAKISKSVIAYNTYKTALIIAMPAIITKDAFPKYSLLKPTNIPWLTFLIKDFVTIGAQTYGWPGFPPISI